MQRLTLRFDDQLEHRYREHRLPNDLRLLRRVASFSLALALLIVGLSWVVPSEQAIPVINRWMHIAMVTVLGLGTISVYARQTYLAMDRRNSIVMIGLALALSVAEFNVTPLGDVPVICIYFFMQVAIFAQPLIFIVRARAIILTMIFFSLAVAFAPNNIDKPLMYLFIQIFTGGIMTIFAAYSGERDQRLAYLAEEDIVRQQARIETLLLSIMPHSVATKLSDEGNLREEIVQSYESATVLFADLVGFTALSASITPEKLVRILNSLFSRFDAAAAQCGVVKVKTIGDAYMAVSGVPDDADNHTHKMADFAFELREAVRKFSAMNDIDLNVRIGIHCGPVVAGVIGTNRLHYDLWGETVRIAAQIESYGIKGTIQISKEMRAALGDNYVFEDRGLVNLKTQTSTHLFTLIKPIIEKTVSFNQALAASSNENTSISESGSNSKKNPGKFDSAAEHLFRQSRQTTELKVYRNILLLSLAVIICISIVTFAAAGPTYLGSRLNWTHIGILLVVGIATLSAFTKQSIRSMDLRIQAGAFTVAVIYGLMARFLVAWQYAAVVAGYFVILSVIFALPMIFKVRRRVLFIFSSCFIFGLWLAPARPQEFTALIFLLVIASTGFLTYIAQAQELTQRATYLAVVETERQKTRGNALLRRIVPAKIADRLQDRVDLREAIVQRYDSVTVLFADLAGFSQLSNTIPPERLVKMLSTLLSLLDIAATKYSVEKIKTIGYTYMAVAGVPDPTFDHMQRMAEFAIEVKQIVRNFSVQNGINVNVKIGMQSGPVVAGVIGTTRFHYDLWGETVNTASRLESHGVLGAIQISEVIKNELSDKYQIFDRGLIELKGMGLRQLFLLERAATA